MEGPRIYMLSVDIEQIKKYNVAGPRYTSYPPAVHFKSGLSEEFVIDRLRANGIAERDLSLYFHLPFCQSLCWYCGCNTVITKTQSQSATYISYLAKELRLMSRAVTPRRKVTQIHFGGGTPTFLLPAEIRALGELVRSHFEIGPDVEASVEIDPRRLTFEHIGALRDAGMNRVSVGVQDFDPQVQSAVNRIQPFEQTREVVDWIRAAGFHSLSIDLIYGLPFQTADSFRKTLDRTLSLNPDRLALFSYAHVPWIKPAQRILKAETMPTVEMKFTILKLGVETLTREGYVYIGMDHFAKRGDELEIAQREGNLQRNFQGYSTRAGSDIHGFGVSSISQTRDLYWQNEKDLNHYYARLDAGQLPIANGYILTKEDQIRREVIMRLMCDMKLDFRSMSASLGLDFETYFRRELNAIKGLEADGLVRSLDGGLNVTDLGRLLIRNVAMCFDGYLASNAEGVYSRTI
jgi:oxygen-independent coproporphyrinogen III oxidase